MKFRIRSPLHFILLISVLLRIAAAFYMSDQVTSLPGTNDQVSYHTLAVRVLQGHGFSFGEPWWPMTAANAPTAHWSFLYTFFVAGVYALVGIHPLAVRLIQAVVVGILQPYLAYLLAGQLFSRSGDPVLRADAAKPGAPIPLLAAAITAVYAYFVYYAPTLMTEPFYITAILGVMVLSIRYVHRLEAETNGNTNRWRFGVQLGILLAFIVLLRQLFLLFIPFLSIWLLWNGYLHRRFRQTFGQLALAGVIVVLSILPFTVYNYLRFDRFVLLNTNAGYAFFLANHPIYGTHFIDILPQEMGSYGDLIPEELRTLDEASLEQELLRRGIGFVIEDPWRYVLLSLSRIPSYFKFWPSASSSLYSNIARVGSFGLFLPFMLYGLYRSIKYRPSAPLMLVYLFAVVYAGIHILSWTLIRYRLPVDAIGVTFAAYGIVALIQRRISVHKPSSLAIPEPKAEH